MLDARVLRTREHAGLQAASASVSGQRSMVVQATMRTQPGRSGNSRRGSRLWRFACVLLAMVPLSSAGTLRDVGTPTAHKTPTAHNHTAAYWKLVYAQSHKKLPPPPPRRPPTTVPVPGQMVTVHKKLTGLTTSARVGTSGGHIGPFGNDFIYLKRLGVNVLRLFQAASAKAVMGRVSAAPRYGQDLLGHFVTNAAQYTKAVALIRTPQGHDRRAKNWAYPINWFNFDSAFGGYGQAFSGNAQGVIATAQAYGIQVLSVMDYGCVNVFFNLTYSNSSLGHYWGERWELYKLFYSQTLWMYQRGVTRFEIHNEPELDQRRAGCWLTASVWVDNYLIRVAAIRDAFADLNVEPTTSVLHGRKGLTPTIYVAPFLTAYAGALGQLSVQHNNATFPALPNGTYPRRAGVRNIDMYSYHTYGRNGGRMALDAQHIRSEIIADAGINLPIAVSEYNVKTAASWDMVSSSADTSSYASRLGVQTAYLLTNVEELDVFVFNSVVSAAMPNSHIKKNGIHNADIAFPYNVGDSTRCAETFRLLSVHAGRGKPLLAFDSTQANSDTRFTMVTDDSMWHYITSVNSEPQSLSLAVATAALGVTAGSRYIVTEVSGARYADVPASGATDASAVVRYTQPAYSTIVLQVAKPGMRSVVTSVARDTHVANGANSKTNYGYATTLNVATSPVNQDQSSIAMLKFDLTQARIKDVSKVTSAVLTMTVASGSSCATNIMTVLGLPYTDWGEHSITWKTVPFLLDYRTNQTIRYIHQNFVNWTHGGGLPASQTMQTNPPLGYVTLGVAGHLAVGPTDVGRTVSVDVSDWIRTNGLTTVSLAVYRPFRFNGSGKDPKSSKYFHTDNISDTHTAFHSRESGPKAPVLTLTVAP